MKNQIATFLLSAALVNAAEKSPAEPLWKPLFDGETLSGWTNAKGKEVKEGNWVAEDGILTRKSGGSGSLVTEKEFGDFEFAFEWKISEGGNSGVKYRVQNYGNQVLGLEYQILDDSKHPDGKNGGVRQTAALYDLKEANEQKKPNPVGEWNQSRILVKEGVVTHYLNGEEVMRLEIPSEEWEKRFKASKYKKNEGFGVNAQGRIMLQDHGNEVSFRELKIREF